MTIKICYIDTETTGTNYNKNGLIQIAGMIYYITDNKYEKKKEFNFKLGTFEGDVIEDEALKVNGVTREEIKAYPDPIKVYNELSGIFGEYCDKYNKEDKMFFVGYNSRFDYDFMRQFFEKCGDKYFGSFFFFPAVDVMNTAIVHLIEQRYTLPNFKLATVANYLQIDTEGNFHDAMKDIEITRMIFEKFVNLKGEINV